MKILKISFSLVCMLFIFPIHSFADVAVGDMIVTLGENLTEARKILSFLK